MSQNPNLPRSEGAYPKSAQNGRGRDQASCFLLGLSLAAFHLPAVVACKRASAPGPSLLSEKNDVPVGDGVISGVAGKALPPSALAAAAGVSTCATYRQLWATELSLPCPNPR